MGAVGMTPDDEADPKAEHKSVRVSPDRLAEFDRLMAAGGVKAIVEAVSGLRGAA